VALLADRRASLHGTVHFFTIVYIVHEQVNVPLRIRDAQSERDEPTLRFIGVGYHRERLGDSAPLMHKGATDRLIPNEQIIVLPNQVNCSRVFRQCRTGSLIG
jgi:hypothetical protein